ncbi:SAM-dependent methyltransferase [Candidatus Gottesmanbacteria bacterium RIFCSPHIGHO2_02_FULL_39_11]|uniref:SAM-dependent methyltransferase n=1 Tax=Candidatus Gottesmanbacteria bacterium RIFCSPHIGHO2_02_FULL_39_11 TaxID=1798382 RepID=A0A1F5ZJP5_9BACT|nr:MAG: SAM-dependent methyltransferase [Candidatus Gottesmanbacteria bacterium RIFCSPHIGHO2_02_FULL_39_11]
MEKNIHSNLHCRLCDSPIDSIVIDLGLSPIANDLIAIEDAYKGETFFPLTMYLCKDCLLAQVPTFKKEEEIFTDHYPYFSSFSSSWLLHAKTYVEMMIKRFNLNKNHKIIEIASNDGYLLQYFKEKNYDILGIEPTRNTAEVAVKKGIPTRIEFFGKDLALKMKKEGITADIMIANNVAAHVPDINDFLSGFPILLKEEGILTIEVQHLYELLKKNQFDTIYHEHFYYWSLHSIKKALETHGLKVFDFESLTTHGGSMRIFACKKDSRTHKVSSNVNRMLQIEKEFGITSDKGYRNISKCAQKIRVDLLNLLYKLKKEGKRIAAYGAPAKGNTLLNFSSIRKDFIDYTVDANPHKQNHLLPGTRIPIFNPDIIKKDKPNYVLILPWNLKDEITDDLSFIREWGGRFIIPVPSVEIVL